MSKSSCITHTPNQQLVIIREDYLAICEGDHCAAALLNIFEYWTNVKLANQEQVVIENDIAFAEGLEATWDTGLWIYKRVPDLKDELLGLFGESKISAGLAILHEHGFIIKRTNPRFKWDKTLQYMLVIEAVENSLSKIQSRSRKNKASKALIQVSEGYENKAAIPETTTEDTTKTISRKSAKGSKSTISAELMNPMKDAIVTAFGWSWKDMTKTEIGIVQSTAKELCTAGFEPDRVASFYAWCRAKFTSFTPRVMATHLSEYRNSRLNGNSEPEKVYAAPYHKPIVIEENPDAIPMPQSAKDALQLLKDKMYVKDGYHATKTTD